MFILNTRLGVIMNINKRKILFVVVILIAFLMLVYGILKWNKGTELTDDTKVIERVDISHTYKQLPDGVYKMYVGAVMLMSSGEEGFRLEATIGSIVENDLELSSGVDLTGEQMTAEILLMEISDSLDIKVNNKETSMKDLIQYVSRDSTSDKSVLQIIIKDDTVSGLYLVN